MMWILLIWFQTLHQLSSICLLSCPGDLPSRVFWGVPLSQSCPPEFSVFRFQVGSAALLSLWNFSSCFSWVTSALSWIPLLCLSWFMPSSFQSIKSTHFLWQNKRRAEILSPLHVWKSVLPHIRVRWTGSQVLDWIHFSQHLEGIDLPHLQHPMLRSLTPSYFFFLLGEFLGPFLYSVIGSNIPWCGSFPFVVLVTQPLQSVSQF